ncbi:hypothetical protein [Kitasatospora sp. NPDC094011]|uniref:hypothetical protein n=1 Tax=Kitasatospora sp. NPDC094011 TaxID=3364090 RepID=UPI0037FC3605
MLTMSVDAAVYVRRTAGPALTPERFLAALSLPTGDTGPRWLRTVGPDGSVFDVRLSTDPESVAGPDVGAPQPGLADRAYDCYLHVTIAETADDGDSLAALRGYCRWAVARLHAAEEPLESVHQLDSDCLYSYWIDLPGPPAEAEVVLWLGAQEPPVAAEFSLTGAADLAAAGGPFAAFTAERPGRLIAPVDDTGDAVTYTVAFRAEELPYAAGAYAPAAAVDAGQLDGFVERLLGELGRYTPGADLACWVNGRLHRYEVELPAHA